MDYPVARRLPVRPAYHERAERESGALVKIVALLLGILVGVLSLVVVLMWASAHEASAEARTAAAKAGGVENPPTAGHGHAVGSADGVLATPSFAGRAPANADDLAAAHRPFPAELPALQAGPMVNVNLGIQHRTVEVAPGIEYQGWTISGTAPGPVIRVREGQTVRVTLRNEAPIPHSIDFHAARIAPNVAFRDVAPGKSFTFTFQATDPGIYMYHCGTKPILAHIASGMYGAIVVEPKKGLPKADREYALVSSEWYLNSPGLQEPASLDMLKASQMKPDWVTWNGYANQYVQHPLTAKPGETVRFWVLAAGPSLGSDFHVVGTVFDRAWIDQDLSRYERGVQTVHVAPGGGGVFDVEIDDPGVYPVVSHSFASAHMGQVALLKVGAAEGAHH